MNEQMRLFAIGLTMAVLGLGATSAAIGGFADRRVAMASSELAMAEGILMDLSADRKHFSFVDQTPAAEAKLKDVFGLTQPEDDTTPRNVRLSCVLSSELTNFAGFLQPGAHYRIHYRGGGAPNEVVRIQPIVAPTAECKANE